MDTKAAGANGLFEVRLKLTETFAQAVRVNPAHPGMRRLGLELNEHGAGLFNILEEFRHWAGDPANAQSCDEKVQTLYAMTRRVLDDKTQSDRWARTYKVVMAGRSAFTEDDRRVQDLEKMLPEWIERGVIEKTRRAYFPADGKMHGVIPPNYGVPK
jgi:hypothetical protein